MYFEPCYHCIANYYADPEWPLLPVALYFIGKRLQARQEQSDEQIQSMKQPMTLLIIDKKRLKLERVSGLPDQVIQQTPWYAETLQGPGGQGKRSAPNSSTSSVMKKILTASLSRNRSWPW